jgi:hypothetical protein
LLDELRLEDEVLRRITGYRQLWEGHEVRVKRTRLVDVVDDFLCVAW